MLSHLSISNFAIIDRLALDLAPGFNVLTGETGAGKSIVVDALTCLLGGRADSQNIRAGADQALIEGALALDEDLYRRAILPWLERQGLAAEDSTLLVGREINRAERNLCRLNGRLVPLGALREAGQLLLDVHNQGEHLSLLRVREHLGYLDRYAALTDRRAQVAERVAELQRVRSELESLITDERELARRIDRLRYQVQEIAAAQLSPGEEEQLVREHSLLTHAERLLAELGSAYTSLYEGSEEQRSALDLAGEAARALGDLAVIDPRLDELRAEAESAQAQLSELGRALRDYLDEVEYNPQRLRQVEERLELIYNLKRKYGESVEEILAFAERSARELESITHSEETIGRLRVEGERTLAEIGRMAGELSRARSEAARRLSTAIQAELADLNMERSRFSVAIEQRPANPERGVDFGGRWVAFDATGIDRIEFLVSPNPGEPLKPLAKIASGGETARIMLALKTVLSMADPVPILIFDEIDAGLGARAGEVIGRKLWNLSRRHQVVAITHLAQIAALADAHFKVSKEVTKSRTLTRVEQLGEAGRIEELAQMLGATSAAGRQSAEQMYQQAQHWVEEARKKIESVA